MTSENQGNLLPNPSTMTDDLKLEHKDMSTIIPIPKRPGRKKRDNSINNQSIDTQPLFEQPIILEGKRSRKPTSRLELSDLETPKKELTIPQGHGKPLGEIPYINYQLTQASNDILSSLSSICFGRRINKTNIRDHLREFNGFEFDRNSDEYQRHLSNLIKLKKDQLQSLSDLLGLSSTVDQEQAEMILKFLFEPIDNGQAIPEQKMSMRNSTKLRETIRIDDEEKNVDDELFDVYEDEEDEDDDDDDDEADDDYIGSDEESSFKRKYDDEEDPDDFVYQPGKKTPKKRSMSKRSKRKRTVPVASKRGRKKTKSLVSENEPMSTNNDETKTTDLNDNQSEQRATPITTDIIPEASTTN